MSLNTNQTLKSLTTDIDIFTPSLMVNTVKGKGLGIEIGE